MALSFEQQLQSVLTQGFTAHSYTVILLSFLAGVVSFMSPCVMAMLPITIGYIGGYSGQSRLSLLQQMLWFILGFALVLTALGILAGMLGTLMGAMVGVGWYYFLGVLAILMGLQLLEVIQLPLPQFVTRMPVLNPETRMGRILAPVILGAAFGAASSPCSTPFLTAILAFISREESWLLGGLSLFAYALGESLPLLVVGLFTGLLKKMATLRRVGSLIVKLSAIVFILAGLRLIAQAAGWLDALAFY